MFFSLFFLPTFATCCEKHLRRKKDGEYFKRINNADTCTAGAVHKRCEFYRFLFQTDMFHHGPRLAQTSLIISHERLLNDTSFTLFPAACMYAVQVLGHVSQSTGAEQLHM